VSAVNDAPPDAERNRLTRRVRRYAEVGGNVGGVAARIAARQIFGNGDGRDADAAAFAAALGGLKGPIMKVAQLLATIPEAVPAEYAAELAKLQSHAPPMGPSFVKRRMAAELGSDWASMFGAFEREAAASASLGQVHRATSREGEKLAVKLQYPDMQSAVEADLNQLRVLFSLHRRMRPAIETSEIAEELSDRLREELDYEREAAHMALYRIMLGGEADIRVPGVHPDLSTRRLLTMGWLDGNSVLAWREHPLEDRNRIAQSMFRAWWVPFSRYGAIHGDPHLGNYTVFTDDDGRAAGINLLDYGCIRTFQPKFVQGVIDLYRGLIRKDRALVVHAYETWGFAGLSNELIDVLTIWAEFIYGPMLEDRTRILAEQVKPGEYGRREAFRVHQGLKEKGPVTVPREFVFMDRAAIGLGSVFLHLGAELNFHRMFEEAIAGFDLASVETRQRDAFAQAGVPLP
jgi:predicted unusual protein kinase regulating ubiquinone biosynthesis (AarF/ABC1/UbiB family)